MAGEKYWNCLSRSIDVVRMRGGGRIQHRTRMVFVAGDHCDLRGDGYLVSTSPPAQVISLDAGLWSMSALVPKVTRELTRMKRTF